MGKSGTTALYTAISRAITGPVDRFFEKGRDIVRRSDPANALVAKVLLEKVSMDDVEWLRASFDRRVFLVRDPRDVLVSRLLYKVRDMDIIYDEDKFGTWLDALRSKERDPGSIGVVELYEMLESLTESPSYLDAFPRVHRSAVKKWERLSDVYHLVRYEAFIDGETSDLSDYLGFEVTPDVEVDARWQRVTRSKGYGDWKHWFLDADLEYVRAEAAEFMHAFGYDQDWHTDDDPAIEAETTSDYVEYIVSLRLTGQG